MRTFWKAALAGLFLAAASGAASAQEAVLTITDGTQTVELTREELAGMKQEVVETTSAWTEGMTKFSGPSFTTVLNEAGLNGATINAEALDKYSLDIPRETLTGEGAIIAISMNDEPLPEDRAPFWIIFDYDSAPEMNDEEHQGWSVYQLSKLTVKP